MRRFRAALSAVNVKPGVHPSTVSVLDTVVIIRNPSRSIRKTLQLMRMLNCTILTRDLRFHACNIQMVQGLNPNYLINRRSFAETMIYHFFAIDRNTDR